MLINNPAIVALKRLQSVPAATAFHPKRAISCFLFGAMPPIPPISIAIDEMLANPHSENVTMATVLADRFPINGDKLVNATNSFNITF